VLGHFETLAECEDEPVTLLDPVADVETETECEVVGGAVCDADVDSEAVVETDPETDELAEIQAVLLRDCDVDEDCDSDMHDVDDGVIVALRELDPVDELDRHIVGDSVVVVDTDLVTTVVEDTDLDPVGVALRVRETEFVKVTEEVAHEDTLRLGEGDVDGEREYAIVGEADALTLGERDPLGLPDSSCDMDALPDDVIDGLTEDVTDTDPVDEGVVDDDSDWEGDCVSVTLVVSVTEMVDVDDGVTEFENEPELRGDGELLLDCERDCVPVFERVPVAHDDEDTVEVLDRHAVEETERVEHADDDSDARADDDVDTETLLLEEGELVGDKLIKVDDDELTLPVAERELSTEDVPEKVGETEEDTDDENDEDTDPVTEFDADGVRVTVEHAEPDCEIVEHAVVLTLMVELALAVAQGDETPLVDIFAVDDVL
jgi:hypothetical protein